MNPNEFDQLWAFRHQKQALHSCFEALQNAENSFDWQWRRARYEHFLWMRNGDSIASKSHLETAHQAAQRALSAGEKRVESLFWAATCELEWARARGKLFAARVLGRCEKQLDGACKHDEGFHFGGPLRVLGRVIAQKPLLLGGSLDRALTFYEASLRHAPHNSTTLLYKADAQIRDNQPGPAKKTLRFLLENADATNWGWETQRDRTLAAKWLETRF